MPLRVQSAPGEAVQPANLWLSASPQAWRRAGSDRRSKPTPRLSRYLFWGGRRRAARRTEEHEGSFVDRFTLPVVLAVLWVALMNLGDCFFTLTHLQAGGIEVNPVAAALLESGRFGFVFIKGVLIAVALVVLCVHKNFQLARTGLWVSGAAYTLLLAYHLWLFFM